MKLLVVSAVWLVISILLGGVGALARRAFGSRVADESDVFFDWWIGWALTVAFLLAWHLALAITPLAWAPLAVAGVAGVWMTWKDWARVLQPTLTERRWLVALILLAYVALAAFPLGPEWQFDTSLYHLQTVRWSQSYAVVPGVANIHSRFATNSSFFLFAALVETVRIGGTNLRLAAGILFLPLIVQGIFSLHAAAMGQRKMDVLWWFQVLMIPAALWQARHYASALSPDGVVFVLTVVLSAELLRMLYRRDETPQGNDNGIDWDYRIFGMVLLAGIAVTVKVNFAIFGGAVAAISLWKSPTVGTSRPLFTRIIVFALIVGALYVVHGVMLSGYLAYPSPIGSLPVDWRLPHWRVQADAEWIVSWARSPGMNRKVVIGNNDWLPRWVANTVLDHDVIAVAISLAVAGMLTFAGQRKRLQSAATDRATRFMFFLPAFLSLVVWFVTAPAIRFALGPLWVIAVASLAMAAANSGYSSLDEQRTRIALRGALLLVLAAAGAVGLNESGWTPPAYPLKQITTLSGLTVNLPAKGDQCGDAPLPCASIPPDPRLELRQPGTLAKGFRIAREVRGPSYLRVNTPTGSVNDSRK